jgi:threonine aldolase
MTPIDLRSDTVTTPSPGMRRAMAEAPVGDDQYGEDPSVNRLQERIAELLGKEAALFVPSGTMANQIGLKILTRPGDEVILGDEAHIVWHESGAGAANSGVQFAVVGRGGLFSAADLRAAYKPPGHIVFPPTTLVAVENTHNRGGGVVFPQEDAVAICAAARELGMASYLDGARIFNAAAASGRSLAELAAPRCRLGRHGEGLGCRAGASLAATRRSLRRAGAAHVRGAMRQSGILARPPLGARPQPRPARRGSACRLWRSGCWVRGVSLDPARCSNIVIFTWKRGTQHGDGRLRAQEEGRAGLGLWRGPCAR